jgi:hypothetical protein
MTTLESRELNEPLFLKPNRFLLQRPEPTLNVNIGVRVVVIRSLLLNSGILKSFDVSSAGHLATIVTTNCQTTVFDSLREMFFQCLIDSRKKLIGVRQNREKE